MWINERPNCPSNSIYSTRVASELLGISENTLRKYRLGGYIQSTPQAQYRGEQINRLFDLHLNGVI